jgi:hypothetical protein
VTVRHVYELHIKTQIFSIQPVIFVKATTKESAVCDRCCLLIVLIKNIIKHITSSKTKVFKYTDIEEISLQ